MTWYITQLLDYNKSHLLVQQSGSHVSKNSNLSCETVKQVYLLVHTPEGTKLESVRETTNHGPGKADEKMGENESLVSPKEKLIDGELHDLSLGTSNTEKNESEMMLSVEPSCTSSCAGGVQWDVFRRQDVPKLAEYLQRTFQKPDDSLKCDFVSLICLINISNGKVVFLYVGMIDFPSLCTWVSGVTSVV